MTEQSQVPKRILVSVENALLRPPFRVKAGIVVAASLLFILYFQFLYGPVWATFFVLAFVAYAAAIVFFSLGDYEKRILGNPENNSFAAHLLRREDLRESLGFWARAAINFLYALFCLLARSVGGTHTFDAPLLYSLVLIVIWLILGEAKKRNTRHPDTAERRDRFVVRMISVLLLLLALAFAAITAGVILDGRTSVWPAFILTFQILFTGMRLFLYGMDSIRNIGTGNTLLHMISDVNLTVVLVAVYTAVSAFLGRFCPEKGLFLVLSVLSGSLVLSAILHIALRALKRGWKGAATQAESTF